MKSGAQDEATRCLAYNFTPIRVIPEEASPSYHTVYNIVKAMDPALLTLAHEGSDAYNQAYDLLYRREAEAPNALWQADHTLLDILLLNDKDQPQKPWLSVILDDCDGVFPLISGTMRSANSIDPTSGHLAQE